MANDNDTMSAVQKILQAESSKITKTFLEGLFAGYHDKETNTYKDPNYKPNQHFTLTNEMYPYVKESVDTTLGKLVFNRYVLEDTGLIDKIGYWNKPLDEDSLADLNVAVNVLLINDAIPTSSLGAYIDHRDRMGFWCSTFLSTSITSALLKPQIDVEKRKKELFEEYRDKLHSNNPTEQILASNKMEKELMGMVRKNLESDVGYDMYRSGSANLDNNYKTINVMLNPVFNDATKKFDIPEHSLMNGVTKYDIPALSNIVVAGAYPSAVGTAEAGYMSKIIMALMQSIQIDPNRTSDCGSNVTIPFFVTKKNARYVLDRYINAGGKKVLITRENVQSYIGQTINLYTPQGCKNKKICAKCGGHVFQNLGVTNVGLLVTQFTMKLLNLKLKSKHNLSQSADVIPVNYLFADHTTNAIVDNGVLKNKAKMRMFIPKLLEEINGFVKEATQISCMGVFPVKFYDKNDNEIQSTIMTFPCQVDFTIYSDIQEDPENYIVTYEPNSEICTTTIRQSIVNVEFFINQIYLYSTQPQIPYNLMTNLMFRCMELNKVDLTVSSIVYEMLAMRVCRSGNDSFAKAFANNPSIDQMSYDKLNFRSAVQEAGILQGVLFQDLSKSINVGMSRALDGIKPEETPFEHIIRA